MGNLIYQLIVGLIVGVLARLLLPGKEAFPDGALGWLLTAVLGILGAWLGQFIATSIWRDSSTYTVGWVMSIVGAIILLLLYRLIMGRRV